MGKKMKKCMNFRGLIKDNHKRLGRIFIRGFNRRLTPLIGLSKSRSVVKWTPMFSDRNLNKSDT
jgi:hypothetical protein